MLVLLASLLLSLRGCLQTRAALHAENLALRHQLLLLQRVHQNRRLRLRSCDRLVWVWLFGVWPNWRSALCIVKPETVIAWHRQGFRLYWKWKSRVPHGRPSVPTEVQNLIQTMSSANPHWGAPRLHGELQKLGIHLAHSTWNQNADVENLLRMVQNGLIGRVPILLLSRPVGFGRHHARY